MYFNLPVDQPQQPERPASDPWDSSKWTEQPIVPTPNMTNIRDESFSSILANLNEHKCTYVHFFVHLVQNPLSYIHVIPQYLLP
jgi:hypothetical protein